MPSPRVFRLLCAAACLLLAGFLQAVPSAATPPDSTAFDEGRAAFAVQFGDEVISRRIMAITARPDTTVRIAVASGPAAGGYEIDAPAASIRPHSPSAWHLSAPSRPGLYPVVVTDTTTGESVRIQLFVLRLWDHEGRRLNGYRIGRYEMDPRRGLDVYEPPSGFIRVTSQNKEVPVSPHFRLEQFLCKQTPATPQYALVRIRLLQRLERILTAVNARGHSVPTLHVMSGYRTPHYNRAIGNTTEYSRHLYGDAADIFVDADGDGWMDDLTGDGRVTVADAHYLARIVKSIPTPNDSQFEGGLSTYGSTSHHGPFVHVDLRGYRARW